MNKGEFRELMHGILGCDGPVGEDGTENIAEGAVCYRCRRPHVFTQELLEKHLTKLDLMSVWDIAWVRKEGFEAGYLAGRADAAKEIFAEIRDILGTKMDKMDLSGGEGIEQHRLLELEKKYVVKK